MENLDRELLDLQLRALQNRALQNRALQQMGDNSPETDYSRLDLPEIAPHLRERLNSVTRRMRGLPQDSEEFRALREDAERASSGLEALALPRSDRTKVERLQAADPRIKLAPLDPEGPIVVNVEEDGGTRQFFVNKPGVSNADLEDFMVENAFQLPLIFAGGIGGKAVAGGLGRVVGAAAGAGTGSAARDVAAGTDVDTMNAALSAGTVGAFEAVGPFLANYVAKVVSSGRYYVPGEGFTPLGKRALKRMDIDPDSVTPELAKTFDEFARQTPDKRAAFRRAQAKSLPGPEVPLTQGDLTRDVTIQGMESSALRGGLGEEAAASAVAVREAKDAALKQNAAAIQQQIGRGGRLSSPQEGVAAAQSRLGEEARVLKQRIDAAYELARSRGASVLSEGLEQAARHAGDAIQTFNPEKAAGVVRQINQLRNLGAANIKEVKMGALENWRSQLSSLTQSAEPVEAGAAKRALRAFDDFMDNMLDEALIRGDETALAAFKRARFLRKEFGRKFESNEIVEKIISPDGGQFKMTPSEATNLLFGINSLGGKNGSVRALEHIKGIIGEESKEWAALKEAAFMKLLTSQGKGNVRGETGERIFSAPKFATAVDDVLRKDPEMMRLLFTRKEISLIQQLKRVALDADPTEGARVPGAVNTSNSANAITRILGQLGPMGRGGLAVLQSWLGGARRAAASNAARRALEAPELPPITAPIPAGGAGILGIPAAQAINRETDGWRGISQLIDTVDR